MSDPAPIRTAVLAGVLLIALAAGAAGQARPGGASATRPAGAPFIEEMTWTEVRDALEAGTTSVVVPIGGTEQNGPHMVTGKHNFIVTHAARLIAERIGGTLVAPTIQYVPQGDHADPGFADRPGVITNPGASYRGLLDAAARSLRAHGFTEILFVGDSGGNQAGMVAVADSLQAEWSDEPARVHALTDYYRRSRQHYLAWLLAAYGYDRETVGRHAGIADTSQMLWIHPAGIRDALRAPGGGGPGAGVSGDPTLATAEIGRVGVAFKVDAAVAQYEELTGGADDRDGSGEREGPAG